MAHKRKDTLCRTKVNKWNKPYWSYTMAVKKYGDIYINRNGGWMPANCADKILKVVEQDNFPPENA